MINSFITFSKAVSQETKDLINGEIKQWPKGLRDELIRHDIKIEVGHTFADTSESDDMDEASMGAYYHDKRIIILKETTIDEDDNVIPMDPNEIIATLNHEVAHAVGITLLDNFPETDLFKRLHVMDFKDTFNSDREGYDTLDPTFIKKTSTHNGKDSPSHEAWAESFGSALSSDRAVARLSWDTSPRMHAVAEHILGNCENGRPALNNIEDFDIKFVSTGKVIQRINPHTGKPSRFQRPETISVTGEKLAAINKMLSNGSGGTANVKAAFQRVSSTPQEASFATRKPSHNAGLHA